MLQLFESHAGVLSQSQFELFLLPYLSMIASKVKERLGEAAVPMVGVSPAKVPLLITRISFFVYPLL